MERHHHPARQIYQLPRLAGRRGPDRARPSRDLRPERGARAPERPCLEVDPLQPEDRHCAGWRSRARGENHRDVELVDDRLPHEGVPGERGEAPEEEGRVGLLRALHAGKPLTGGQGHFIQSRCLRMERAEGEERLELRGVLDLLPVEGDPIGPPRREPERGGCEELVVRHRPHDPRVGEGGAVPPEVFSGAEPHEHSVHLGEYRGIVRIGAEEAEGLVEPENLSRPTERERFQVLQEGDLPPCHAAEARLAFLEILQARRSAIAHRSSDKSESIARFGTIPVGHAEFRGPFGWL